MADEVRRSGRANKGHHTKNADALDEPLPKSTKSKPKGDKKDNKPTEKGQAARSQSAQSGDNEEEEEEDAVIRCVCGDQRDIRGRQMICCDKCEVWQHNRCLNLPEGDYWDNKNYYCEQCKPEDHVELLAAMARGEKPWAKKKGQKPPKSRPSDVKPETKQEKPKAPTPQPAQASTASPAQAPAPAPAQTPASVPSEASNGQTEAKPVKKETPKSQPQSPLGEKRRHESVAEKETASKKRRKSSAPHAEKASSQPTIGTEIGSLPPKQKPLAEKLRDTLVPLINAASDSRGYRIPDGETAKSLATKFALQIDHYALLRHGEPVGPESPFTQQIRTIIFNTKKNTILLDRLLSGSLTTEEIASMAAEEMASEEKQREYAAMREANEKQMVLTEESLGPRLRKTHKGEEVVGEDDAPINDDIRAPPLRDRENELDTKPQQPQSPKDTQMVELPEDVGRQPLAVDTASAPTDGVRRPSTTFDIKAVFDQVRSPQNDQRAFLPRRQSSIRAQEQPQQGPGVDADIDRLLKDEDGDVEMSGYQSPTIVWQGSVNMQQMEPFQAVARFVAGGDFGQIIPWDKLLSSTLPIQGRIESQKGDEYIRGLGTTGSHDVSVLALSPVSPGGRAVMDNLYNYFHPRDRWGVVPVDKLETGNDAMRDLYVIPVEEGGSNLPPFLDMLEHCTIETPRKERLMLLALVAKLPEKELQSQLSQSQHFDGFSTQETPAGQMAQPVQAPSGPTNGPSPSPLTNPHGPQYSPVSAAFPQGSSFGNHYPPQQNNGHAPQPPVPSQSPNPPNPKAVEFLGPFIDAPVITQILHSAAGASMTEEQMRNLRHIMEHVPEARVDMGVLSQHLAQKQAANGQP